jgi:cbb3-type cytochrome oxidase subunit 3
MIPLAESARDVLVPVITALIFLVVGIAVTRWAVRKHKRQHRMNARREVLLRDYFERTGWLRPHSEGTAAPPLPPQTHGVCDGCGKASEVIYHLRCGLRMCEDCYRDRVEEG